MDRPTTSLIRKFNIGSQASTCAHCSPFASSKSLSANAKQTAVRYSLCESCQTSVLRACSFEEIAHVMEQMLMEKRHASSLNRSTRRLHRPKFHLRIWLALEHSETLGSCCTELYQMRNNSLKGVPCRPIQNPFGLARGRYGYYCSLEHIFSGKRESTPTPVEKHRSLA